MRYFQTVLVDLTPAPFTSPPAPLLEKRRGGDYKIKFISYL
jgi:hypothetical protein